MLFRGDVRLARRVGATCVERAPQRLAWVLILAGRWNTVDMPPPELEDEYDSVHSHSIKEHDFRFTETVSHLLTRLTRYLGIPSHACNSAVTPCRSDCAFHFSAHDAVLMPRQFCSPLGVAS